MRHAYKIFILLDYFAVMHWLELGLEVGLEKGYG